MPPFERGVYELLVTEAVAAELGKLTGNLEARQTELRPAEALDRIALHLGRVLLREGFMPVVIGPHASWRGPVRRLEQPYWHSRTQAE